MTTHVEQEITVERLRRDLELVLGAGAVTNEVLFELRSALVGPSSPIAKEGGHGFTEVVLGETGYYISVSGLLAKVATALGAVAGGHVSLAGWATLISTVSSLSGLVSELSKEEAQLCVLLKSGGVGAERTWRLPKHELEHRFTESYPPRSPERNGFAKALETLLKHRIVKLHHAGSEEVIVLTDTVFVRAAR